VLERLRVGVVGSGTVLERYHIPAVNAVPEVVRSIVVDVDSNRAERIALKYGFPISSSELSDVARHADIAIVLVPNGLHAPVSCELLNQGIHVLCEKPMARNSEECKAMIEASVRGKAKLCIGHNRRFQQHVKLAKQIIDKGLIGEVVGVTAEEGSSDDWPRTASYFDPVISGGGALLDVGIHSIDLIRWFAGEFKEIKYEGNGSEKTVESDASISFNLSNGASGKVVVSRTRSLAQKLTLIGSEGFIEVGLWSPNLGLRCVKGKAFQNFHRLDVAVARRPPSDGSFVEQLREFVSAIKEGHEVLVTGQVGMAAVEVVRRAYRGCSEDFISRNSRPE
jgi:UDP-N-acetylglucosamine 3-dehydrogenase